MDRTKVMDLADKAGGLFRLTVLLQKRVRELVGGAPKLVETNEINPINIAMAEVEEGAIELVDLSDSELAALEAESQIASEEAEILEALRTRVSGAASTPEGASASPESSEEVPAPSDAS
ncbi:MAG: DNA-directed RNA polymerase subunit omega [Planctomycetota bacterium]|jgi:DNA-directed RNA polymerase subunit K/omega|nr:DNA-directed RNA polymerase subunit omega [Planctomycetota bacterium]